jgi:hypothetical protein
MPMDDTTDAAATRRAPRRVGRGLLLAAALVTLAALTTIRVVLVLWPAGALWVSLSLITVGIALGIPAGLALGRLHPPDQRPACLVLAAFMYCMPTPGGLLLARAGPFILAALPLLALGVAQSVREGATLRRLQCERDAREREEGEEEEGGRAEGRLEDGSEDPADVEGEA